MESDNKETNSIQLQVEYVPKPDANEFDTKTADFEQFKLYVQSEFQQLKSQNRQLSERLENSAEKTKTINKELRALFSRTQHSDLLHSSSVYKKLLFLTTVSIVFACCALLVLRNIVQYTDYSVVTRIQIGENDSLTFPAVTICLQDLHFHADVDDFRITPLTLAGVLNDCWFESMERNCTHSDFEYRSVYNSYYNTYTNCYRINGNLVNASQSRAVKRHFI